MATFLQIERPVAGQPIDLDEWRTAVERIEGVRLANGDLVARDPFTGSEFRVSNGGGDAEVLYPRGSAWLRVFSWRDGRVRLHLDDGDGPAHQAASALATALGAQVVQIREE